MRCCCRFPNQFVSLERCAAARSPLRHTTHRPAAANSFSSTWENQTWCLYILCASNVDHFFCFFPQREGTQGTITKQKKVFFFCLFLRVVNSLCKAHASSSEFLLFLTTQQRKNTFSRAHHAYNCKTSPTTSKTHLLLWVRVLCGND